MVFYPHRWFGECAVGSRLESQTLHAALVVSSVQKMGAAKCRKPHPDSGPCLEVLIKSPHETNKELSFPNVPWHGLCQRGREATQHTVWWMRPIGPCRMSSGSTGIQDIRLWVEGGRECQRGDTYLGWPSAHLSLG